MITIYNYCWQTIIVIYIDIKRKYPTLKVKILISFLQEKDKKHPITSKFYKGIEIKKRKNTQFYSLIYSALTTNRNLFFTFGIYSDTKNLHSDFTKNTFVHANGCNVIQ